MTAPVLAYKKFWIVKPKAATNQIKNPAFAHPDFVEDWTASGTGVTVASSGDQQRRGAYSMQVNPISALASVAYYSPSLVITSGLTYTFSCDIKGVAGQTIDVEITNGVGISKAKTTFVATGYWQRKEVTHTAAESATNYSVRIVRAPTASTAAFYIDGAQFEQASAASTFFDGYSAGCRWTGAIRNSPSVRSAFTGFGGELIDLEDYCSIVNVVGLGHGDWNQILTKMTSGGDMYQTHTRKSRQFSIVVDFVGLSLGEIETKRKALINALRPDLLSNLDPAESFGINWGSDERGYEQRIIRYQGFAANGDEATQPVDIVCVPLSASLTDTPDMPNHQRAVLNFTIPSGLLQGAYNEGKALDLYANFPAEHIVKRDKDGNWCTWNGSAYASLITGLTTASYYNPYVKVIKEGPDGKIYVGGNFTNAGGVSGANNLARWNPVSEAWEVVITGIVTNTSPAFVSVNDMAFDANGDLYITGDFRDTATSTVGVLKITDLSGTPTANAMGGGIAGGLRIGYAIIISQTGDIYLCGAFDTVNSVANTKNIAKWNGTVWSPLSTGLALSANTLAIAPNGLLYIGGDFNDAAYPYLCKWNGSAFSAVGTNTDINGSVKTLAFDGAGKLWVGGVFTNAAGNPNADYIAIWNGTQWLAAGTGANNIIYGINIYGNRVYVGGMFTSIGGLTLSDRVAYWQNGSWHLLDIDIPGNATTEDILLASDGSLYIGGTFSTAGETPDVNAETGVVALNLNVASASANTYPFIQVHGPGTLKSITNYSTGKTIAFDGLTLNAGEWINLIFDPLYLKFQGGWSGRGNLMRYVVAGSDYGDFYLTPGSNLISVFMTGTTTASRASIQWSPQFWGLDGALL